MTFVPENIIIKYFQKQATVDEIQILNQWLGEDEKHAEMFYQMQSIWDSGKKLPQNIINEKWELLYNKIFSETNEKSTVIQLSEQKAVDLKNRFIQWTRYAAALIAGILIATVWYQVRIDVPEQISMLNHVIYNREGTQNLILPDRSSVWLSSNSQITYPEQFANDIRLVSLKGKAFFDVQKDEQAFLVHTENIEIKVTGTEFEVDNSIEKGLTVSLVSGRVEIYTKNESGEQVSHTYLTAGQQATISKDGKLFIENFDKAYVLAWKDGSYRFINEPIEKVVQMISKRYQVKIKVNETLKLKNFTGKITPDMDLQDVMKIIDMSHPVNYKITSDEIYISER